MPEQQNGSYAFVIPLTYANNVQVHQTTKLLTFSLEIFGLPPRPAAIAHLMPPDVSKIDSPLAYRLILIHRAALLKKTGNTNFKKAQACYKNDYYTHIRFPRRFAEGNYVFVEGPLLLGPPEDHVAYERYSKLLLRRTESYQVISVGA